MEQRNNGTTKQRNNGTTKQWNNETMEQRKMEQRNNGTTEQWNNGTTEQWNNKTMEQRNNETTEQWKNGTTEQRNNGANTFVCLRTVLLHIHQLTNCVSATELKSMVHSESINQGYATIASYTYSLQSTEHNQ